MSERPNIRVTQPVYARVKHQDGDESERTFVKPIKALSGIDLPLMDDVRAHFAYSDWLHSQAVAGYSRDFSVYDAGDLRVEALRKTPLTNLMARVGLRRFIPYEVVTTITRADIATIETI